MLHRCIDVTYISRNLVVMSRMQSMRVYDWRMPKVVAFSRADLQSRTSSRIRHFRKVITQVAVGVAKLMSPVRIISIISLARRVRHRRACDWCRSRHVTTNASFWERDAFWRCILCQPRVLFYKLPFYQVGRGWGNGDERHRLCIERTALQTFPQTRALLASYNVRHMPNIMPSTRREQFAVAAASRGTSVSVSPIRPANYRWQDIRQMSLQALNGWQYWILAG